MTGQGWCKVCCINSHLLHLLWDSNCSLILKDKIVNWAHKSKKVLKNDFSNIPLKWSNLLTKIINQYDHLGYQPHTVKLLLPHCQQLVNVTCHNVWQAIYSLLSNEELMIQDNLIFRDNLFEPPCNKPREIKDLNDPKRLMQCLSQMVHKR